MAESLRMSTRFMRSPYRKPRQETYQFARARAEQRFCEIAAGGALACLAERRIGRHETGQRRNLEASRYGETPGLDQLGGTGSDDRRAEDAAAPIRDSLHQTVTHALGVGAIVVGE